jgi:maltose alpha-D-glucosyltransferase/alpha-amylase
VRKQHAAFGLGTFTELGSDNPSVLSYLRELERPGQDRRFSEVILCVNNLSRFPQAAILDLEMFHGRIPVELTGSIPFPKITGTEYMITLPGHGFYWFALQPDPADDGMPTGQPVSSEAEAAVRP